MSSIPIQNLEQETKDCIKELHDCCSQLKMNARERSKLPEEETDATVLETKQAALQQQGLHLFLGLKENHRFARQHIF